MSNDDIERSPLALVLGLAFPGLGHAIRRRWLRSFIWLITVIGALTIVFYQAGVSDISSIAQFYSAFVNELDLAIQVGLIGLHGLQALDAFAVGPVNPKYRNRTDGDLTKSESSTVDDSDR